MTEPPLRILTDGRGVWVYPLTFGRGRLVVGALGVGWTDDGW